MKARRWLGRHRTAVTATAAMILSATVLLAGATVQLPQRYQSGEGAGAKRRRRSSRAPRKRMPN